MEGVKVCAFRRNSIVAPSPLTLLLCQMEQRMTTGKKIKNKDGNFFQRGSIADMPHKSGHCFRGGKDPLGGLFVSFKTNLPKRNKNTLVEKWAHRKLSNRCGTYSMNCSPCPEGRICVDSIHCCSKHAKTANKPFPISSKRCYS